MSVCRKLLCAVLVVFPLLFSATPATAEEPTEWSQWRGASRDGSVSGAAWPDDLSTVHRMWRVQLGRGYASPVVARDRPLTCRVCSAIRNEK